jgi:hypothetical protein
MIRRSILSHLIFISFLTLVGFCLVKAISSQSVTGIVLALVSLGAGIYFLILLKRVGN